MRERNRKKKERKEGRKKNDFKNFSMAQQCIFKKIQEETIVLEPC